MYAGKLLFAQLTDHLPLPIFRQCVQRYGGHHNKIKSFTCLDQFLCMTFAQLYSANAKFSVSSQTGYFKVLRQQGAQVALVFTRVAEEVCAGFAKPVK